MSSQRKHGQTQGDADQRTRGMPGDGVGRREEPGRTGVYPFTSDGAPDDATVRASGSWGRSDYDESGSSETSPGRPADSDPGTTAAMGEGADRGVDLSQVKATADVPGGAMTEGPADRPSGRNDSGGS